MHFCYFNDYLWDRLNVKDQNDDYVMFEDLAVFVTPRYRNKTMLNAMQADTFLLLLSKLFQNKTEES